ncbi:MAG: hypothetical protein JSV73_06280, partial [Flavobacteriaceae bacterium]
MARKKALLTGQQVVWNETAAVRRHRLWPTAVSDTRTEDAMANMSAEGRCVRVLIFNYHFSMFRISCQDPLL